MTIVSSGLKPVLERIRNELQNVKNPEDALFTNRAVVRLVENQYSESKVGNFTIIQDEPESVGGGNRGPSPTGYFISSIGFCENVLFARNAALLGLEIDSLETKVSGVWNRKGLFDIGGEESSFKSITVETNVTTNGSVEKTVEVARLTHRRCPIHATLAKART